MKTSFLFLVTLALFSAILCACVPAAAPAPLETLPPSAPSESSLVLAYYPSWAAGGGAFLSGIPAHRLTHINYAFSNVSAEGKCMLGDPAADVERMFSASESVNGQADTAESAFHGNFNQLLQLKARYPNLKTLISIGGWTWSSNFSAAASDEAARRQFAASCIELYLKQYPGVFDGLDIDWEYPVNGGLSNGTPEDKQNYTLLLAELRRQMDELETAEGREYVLTIAAPAGPWMIQNLEIEKISSWVDWINLMGYDMHGTWETSTHFNAPLYHAAEDPADARLNVHEAVQAYLQAAVPAGKLVLGVPFFGHGWAGVENLDNGLYQPASGAWKSGSFSYNEIQRDCLSSTCLRYWNEEAQAPWLYDAENGIFISYDDAQSLEAKARYAREQGLKGVMVWEITQGDESLVEALLEGLGEKGK